MEHILQAEEHVAVELITPYVSRWVDESGNSLLHLVVSDLRTCKNVRLIERIIDFNPSATETFNSAGASPLANCLSLCAATSLLRQSHQSLLTRDVYGVTPLHRVCSNSRIDAGEAEKMVALLVAANPQSCSVRSKAHSHTLPLHCAIAASRSPNTIKTLLDVYEGAASISTTRSYQSSPSKRNASPLEVVEILSLGEDLVDGDRYSMPLHQAIDMPLPCWQSVLLLAHAFPAATGYSFADGLNPLMRALQKRAPDWLIRCFLEFHPSGVLRRFEDGISPLGFAIARASDEDGNTEESDLNIVILLIKSFPLGILDCTGGNHPIDHALRCRQWSLVNFLLMTFIDIQASSSTANSELPPISYLDLTAELLRRHAPQDTYFLLFKAFPHTVRAIREPSLQLPCHIALSEGCCLETINLLLRLNPKAVDHHDFFGKLPIHIAAERAEPGVLSALLKLAPSSATKHDLSTSKKAPISIAFSFCPPAYLFDELLSACSEVANSNVPPFGILPIFLALEKQMDEETVYTLLCHSMPFLRHTMAPNPNYRGQFHTLIARGAADNNASLTTSLIERLLTEFTLTHLLSNSKHPKTQQSVLDVCHEDFKAIFLERLYLFRYRLVPTTHKEKQSRLVRFPSFVSCHICLDVQELKGPTVGLILIEDNALFLRMRAVLEEEQKRVLRVHNVNRNRTSSEALERLVGEKDVELVNYVIVVVNTSTINSLLGLLKGIF